MEVDKNKNNNQNQNNKETQNTKLESSLSSKKEMENSEYIYWVN